MGRFIMEQVCKRCNLQKDESAFPVRHWKTTTGVARTGLRKVCYECQRSIDNARWHAPESAKRARRTAWQRETADQRRVYRKAYYEGHRDRWLDRESGYRFSEKSRERDAAYEARPEVREAAKARGKAWRATNKARLVMKTRKRQAHVARATPGWAKPTAILAFYEQAEQLTKETGERHEVDHVIPLQGKNVCGLHVETNLRVITATANRIKGHKFEPGTSLSPDLAS